MPNLSAIVVAAGKSRRFQNPQTKKPFALLNDEPVWVHSVRKFQTYPSVIQTILVIAEDDCSHFLEVYGQLAKERKIEIVVGGEERADSVENAIHKVNAECDYVVIHDAARPCFDSQLLNRVVEKAVECGAAIPAIAVSSTIKKSMTGEWVEDTIAREGLFLAQTPQVFRRNWILEAYQQRNGRAVTDDAQLLEQIGYRIALVEGSPLNIKITHPADLALAAACLACQDLIR